MNKDITQSLVCINSLFIPIFYVNSHQFVQNISYIEYFQIFATPRIPQRASNNSHRLYTRLSTVMSLQFEIVCCHNCVNAHVLGVNALSVLMRPASQELGLCPATAQSRHSNEWTRGSGLAEDGLLHCIFCIKEIFIFSF